MGGHPLGVRLYSFIGVYMPKEIKHPDSTLFKYGMKGCIEKFMAEGKSEEQAAGLCAKIHRAKYGENSLIEERKKAMRERKKE